MPICTCVDYVICVYYRCLCIFINLTIHLFLSVSEKQVQQTGGDVTVTGEEQKKGKKPASKTS